MEGNKEQIITPDKLICPICGAVRQDASLERCTECASDLSGLKAIENFTQSLILDARECIRNRKYIEAETKLDVAATIDDRNKTAAKLVRNEIALQKNLFALALKTYQEIADTGFDASAWGVNLNEKIKELEHKLEIERAAKEHYNLALHRSREGYFAEAREELFKAADLAPYLAEIYFLAAKVDYALGAENAVYQDLTRYRQLCPDDPRAIRMEKELANLKMDARINRDQLVYASGVILFAIAVLIIIALK